MAPLYLKFFCFLCGKDKENTTSIIKQNCKSHKHVLHM